jgi:ribosomal protein S18 acetylase RimI-like enzyme
MGQLVAHVGRSRGGLRLAVKTHHERGGLWVTDLAPDEAPRFSLPALGAGKVLIGEAGAETAGELAAAMGGWDPDEVAARLAGGKRCFTATVDGAIAAYGWVTPQGEWIGEMDRAVRLDGDEAYIWQCATLPAHRGRGLYKALLAAMLAALAREGCRRVWIGCALANAPSVRAFAAVGLRPVVTLDYWRLGHVSCFSLAGRLGADPACVAHARAALAASHEVKVGPLRLAWGRRPHE